MKDKIALASKGAFMGIAEAIPGVSGGTIAFITGIYQELIETIKSITPANLRLILSDRKAFWQAINGQFLLTLLVGMFGGLVLGILVISHLLETQKEILWGFFFGLVIASALFLAKDVKWNIKAILCAIGGALLSYFITGVAPADGSDNLLYIFFAGSIAVSALMLPGISGSFILLLFGLYHIVIGSLKSVLKLDFSTDQLLIVVSMTAGVLVGLFSFARVLSYLFKNYEQPTMACLIGVLVGSLNKIWPWKLIETAYDKAADRIISIDAITLPDVEEYKIVSEINLLPTQYGLHGDPKIALVAIAAVVGFTLIGLLGYFDRSA